MRASELKAICSALVRPWPPYSTGQVMPANPASYSFFWKAFCAGIEVWPPASSSEPSGPRRGALASSQALARLRNSSTDWSLMRVHLLRQTRPSLAGGRIRENWNQL